MFKKGKENINWKPKIKKVCPTCKEIFYVIPSRKNEIKHCSRKCQGKAHNVKKICQICGKEFVVIKSRKDTAKYCSNKCKYKQDRKVASRIKRKCKFCNKIFEFPNYRNRQFCSAKCSNTWKARYQNGFKGKHHTEEQKKKFSEYRKKHYNLDNHKDNCQCSGCKATRGEYKGENNPFKNSLEGRKKLSEKFKGREITWNDKVRKGVLKAYKEGRLKPMKGENHPNWLGGISQEGYLYGFNDELKEKIRERDNYQCQLCDITEEEHLIKFEIALSIHHIDYDKKNNEEENLITLCNSCNSKVNKNRSYWKNYFQSLIEEKYQPQFS